MSRFEEVGGRGQLNQNRHLVGQWCATKKTDKHRQTHTPTPSLPPSLPPPSFSFTHTSLWLSHWNGLLKARALVALAILPFPPRNSLLVQMLARLVVGCVACYPAAIPPLAILCRSVVFLSHAAYVIWMLLLLFHTKKVYKFFLKVLFTSTQQYHSSTKSVT